MGSASQACDLLKSGKTWTIKAPAMAVGAGGSEGEPPPPEFGQI